MKGSILWKLAYVFCALAGCLAGYGMFTLTSSNEIKPNMLTKDNTLVREAEDSVFFDGEKKYGEVSSEASVVTPTTIVATPSVLTASPVVTEKPIVTGKTKNDKAEPPKPTPEDITPPLAMPAEPTEISQDKPEGMMEDMPSLGSQWVLHAPSAIPLPPSVTTTPADALKSTVEEEKQSSATEVITYPAKIFGQVPVLNRSDDYVSYFEFAYDLISVLEPEVKQRGLNLNALLAKFALKALFCGVDIEKLDINAPIPRRLAALCLWLAAQVLEKEGCATTTTSAKAYVTDIGNCSAAEKKAVAYLYEQGIIKGYQMPGQKFYPDAGLKTESGTSWLSGVKQCWK